MANPLMIRPTTRVGKRVLAVSGSIAIWTCVATLAVLLGGCMTTPTRSEQTTGPAETANSPEASGNSRPTRRPRQDPRPIFTRPRRNASGSRSISTSDGSSNPRATLTRRFPSIKGARGRRGETARSVETGGRGPGASSYGRSTRSTRPVRSSRSALQESAQAKPEGPEDLERRRIQLLSSREMDRG